MSAGDVAHYKAKMAGKKQHPSELLEFQPLDAKSPQHLEHADIAARCATRSNQTDLMKLDLYRGLSHDHGDLPQPGSEANLAAQKEHRMTLLQAVHLYPKAICWSALLSLAIVMEGYDTALINAFYAFGAFQRQYGVPVGDGRYQVTAAWQSGLTNGAVVGGIIGLFANGYLNERFGYRYTMMGALVSLAAFIFLAFFAFRIEVLLVAQILCGLSWGVFQTLTTTYAAETLPLSLRGALTSNVNLCWLLGQITGLGVLRGMINFNSEWSYRIPFGLQWVWILIVLVAIIFAPDSPWYLVRQGRLEEAKRTLLRLTRRGMDYNVDNNIAMMVHTDELEKKLDEGVSYLDCFRGTNLRRTEIVCMIWTTQVLCGLPVIGYATYFYLEAGFSEKHSFDLSVGMYGPAIFGAFLSQILLRYFGRRTLYLSGCVLSLVILVTAGAVGTQSSTKALWALGSLIVVFIFVFDSTIGPLTYCLVAEIPSTRLRVKTVVLGRVLYNMVTLVTNVLQPRMLNSTAWNWKGKTCFFWAGTCSLCLLWCWFRLPEPKGLTYAELDILFEKRADARKFGQFQKTLESTGYFSFYADERHVERWQ